MSPTAATVLSFHRHNSLISDETNIATTDTDLPTGSQLCWPTLETIKELGGSATVQEIGERVPELLGLSEAEQAVMRPDGITTELYQRLSAARTYLKGAGAIERSARGIWAITEHGRGMTEGDMQGITTYYQTRLRERRRVEEERIADSADDDGGSGTAGADADAAAAAEGDELWREELIGTLLELDPDAFERLSLRLLREAGFKNMEVTGRPGDGGIDGQGVYQLSLVSVPVFFQCKRYSGSVGSGAVRDFRGAMAGRGDNGLLITTGSFSSEAKREATRPGAPPIDLIDGDRLCDLLRDYSIGVATRSVEVMEIDRSFFDEV